MRNLILIVAAVFVTAVFSVCNAQETQIITTKNKPDTIIRISFEDSTGNQKDAGKYIKHDEYVKLERERAALVMMFKKNCFEYMAMVYPDLYKNIMDSNNVMVDKTKFDVNPKNPKKK